MLIRVKIALVLRFVPRIFRSFILYAVSVVSSSCSYWLQTVVVIISQPQSIDRMFQNNLSTRDPYPFRVLISTWTTSPISFCVGLACFSTLCPLKPFLLFITIFLKHLIPCWGTFMSSRSTTWSLCSSCYAWVVWGYLSLFGEWVWLLWSIKSIVFLNFTLSLCEDYTICFLLLNFKIQSIYFKHFAFSNVRSYHYRINLCLCLIFAIQIW